MADVKISALPASTTPLAGTEVLPIVQGTTTTQVSIDNLTAGKSVSATSFVPSGATIPTNGVYLPAANAVGVATNTTNAIYINSSQQVGVGTSSPAYKLHIKGGLNNSLSIDNDGNRYTSAIYANNGTYKVYSYWDNTSVGFTLGTDVASAFLQFQTGGATRLYVGSTGGVSIGNTTDPGATNLNVSGLIFPQQAASAPTYQKGAIYFDTTLNKLRVGGATGWETITSV